MVGEWSLATTDCAKWLNGYNAGSRFDGTFLPGVPALGTCVGQNDITNKTIWTPEYKNFLQHYTQKQMDAYESGSSQGWFFWSVQATQRTAQHRSRQIRAFATVLIAHCFFFLFVPFFCFCSLLVSFLFFLLFFLSFFLPRPQEFQDGEGSAAMELHARRARGMDSLQPRQQADQVLN
jgi:hypothetical protein